MIGREEVSSGGSGIRKQENPGYPGIFECSSGYPKSSVLISVSFWVSSGFPGIANLCL